MDLATQRIDAADNEALGIVSPPQRAPEALALIDEYSRLEREYARVHAARKDPARTNAEVLELCQRAVELCEAQASIGQDLTDLYEQQARDASAAQMPSPSAPARLSRRVRNSFRSLRYG